MMLWNHKASLAGGKKCTVLITERCMWSDFTEPDLRRKSDCLILYAAHTILPWALQHTGHQHSLILWLRMLDAPGWPKLQFTSFLCLAGRAISTQPSSGTVLSLWETNAVLTMNCFKVCAVRDNFVGYVKHSFLPFTFHYLDHLSNLTRTHSLSHLLD